MPHLPLFITPQHKGYSMKEKSRRNFIRSTAVAGGVVVAGCLHGDEEPAEDEDVDDTEPDVDDTDEETDDGEEEPVEEAAYEVWALDQGTDTGYIYEASDNPGLELAETIDFGEHVDADNVVPHMVDYSSDYEYAAVGCTAGASTVIVRTEDHEVVEVVETGPSSHFASFAPDDSFIQVDVIAEGAIKRIDVDLENEEFELLDDEIDTNGLHEYTDQAEEGDFEGSDPVCHQYTGDGYSYHTLGPGYGDGALVIVDTEEFEVERVFTHEQVPTNCGTVPHPTEDKFYLTAGLPAEEDEDGVGEWYVFDTSENLPITTEGEVVDEDDLDGTITSEHLARDARGVDTHGFWFTPDASELWLLNRQTNDGVVIDPDEDEVIEEIDQYGPEQHDTDAEERDAPDIMWASPDGEQMFVTLRGPNPLSGDPHAATGINPGFSVIDVESREIEEIVQPDEDNEDSDFHGIGVVPRGVEGEYTSPAW